MAESPREQALAALKALLEGMTGTRHWGGSYEHPVLVERTFRPFETTPSLPWLGVVADSGSTFEVMANVGLEASHTDRLRVVIYGWVRGNDATSPDQWRERLHRDVRLTLSAGQRLGGLIRGVEWGEEETDEGALAAAGIAGAGFAQGLTLILDDVIAVE